MTRNPFSLDPKNYAIPIPEVSIEMEDIAPNISNGLWNSKISPEKLADGKYRISWPIVAAKATYWIESQPGKNYEIQYHFHDEKECESIATKKQMGFLYKPVSKLGNAQNQSQNQSILDLESDLGSKSGLEKVSIGSKIQEFGGNPWTLLWETAESSINIELQKLYNPNTPCFVVSDTKTGALYAGNLDEKTRLLTPENSLYRFACPIADLERNRVICICEDYTLVEKNLRTLPETYLVSVSITSSEPKIQKLASGADFYNSPTLSPDSRYIAWIEWDIGQMPWTQSRLHIAQLNTLGHIELDTIVQAKDVAITQPCWNPHSYKGMNQQRHNFELNAPENQPSCSTTPGSTLANSNAQTLVFCSDITGWKNLYQITVSTEIFSNPQLDLNSISALADSAGSGARYLEEHDTKKNLLENVQNNNHSIDNLLDENNSLTVTYQGDTSSIATPLYPASLEFAGPDWILGFTDYGFINSNEMVVNVCREGIWSLELLDIHSHKLKKLSETWEPVPGSTGAGFNRAATVCAQTSFPNALVEISYYSGFPSTDTFSTESHYESIDYYDTSKSTGPTKNLRKNKYPKKYISPDGFSHTHRSDKELKSKPNLSLSVISPTLSLYSHTISEILAAGLSQASPITWRTSDNTQAHGFLYLPVNHNASFYSKKPPIMVLIHGGPTSQAYRTYDPAVQFWTTRGIAVLQVNHRGSTGFGRSYQDAINLSWGVKDVQDTIAGVEYLIDQNLIDPTKVAIRGGSAGGFTTMSCLLHSDLFSIGCSRYGIGDLTVLAKDTHKFESRYMDIMIGSYQHNPEIYRLRSPLAQIEKLHSSLLILQGTEDKVVPPGQATEIAKVLSGKKLPYAMIIFPNEGHGFSQPDTIIRALNSELSFLVQIWNLPHPDNLEKITVHNL